MKYSWCEKKTCCVLYTVVKKCESRNGQLTLRGKKGGYILFSLHKYYKEKSMSEKLKIIWSISFQPDILVKFEENCRLFMLQKLSDFWFAWKHFSGLGEVISPSLKVNWLITHQGWHREIELIYSTNRAVKLRKWLVQTIIYLYMC